MGILVFFLFLGGCGIGTQEGPEADPPVEQEFNEPVEEIVPEEPEPVILVVEPTRVRPGDYVILQASNLLESLEIQVDLPESVTPIVFSDGGKAVAIVVNWLPLRSKSEIFPPST